MNERQFDHKGGVYREGRPAYPPALFERLQSAGLLAPTDIAADVGAARASFPGNWPPMSAKYTLWSPTTICAPPCRQTSPCLPYAAAPKAFPCPIAAWM